jgi:hypothetical protein
MTYDWQIQPGDFVKVFPCDNSDIFYRGVVKHMPQQTGEAWIIDSDGVISYQQTYNRIVLVKRDGGDSSR